MAVLSIIACGMLEDELVQVLSKDHELKQLIVVENRDNFGFRRKLKAINCNFRTAFMDRITLLLENESNLDSGLFKNILSLFPFFKEMHERRRLGNKKRVTVVVNLLKLGLHSNIELLKAEVYKNIREMAPFSDNILVFFGMCGHVLGKLEEDFADLECPLSFLRDKNGEIVEDCISLALGGNEAYAKSMLENSAMGGTFYMTPMWASSWKQIANEVKMEKEYTKVIKHYCFVAKIDTGLVNNPDFNENVQEYAQLFGMKIIDIKGTMEVAEQSYRAARNSVTGKQ
jgi:hypothetical protein